LEAENPDQAPASFAVDQRLSGLKGFEQLSCSNAIELAFLQGVLREPHGGWPLD